jgi:hypothetical protein
MNRQAPQHRHVYVIGPPVGLQKVGLATDPKQRLATLQTACPFDLFLHLAVAVPFAEAHAIERRAHRLLARSCVRNEWFEVSPADAIAAVKSAAAPREGAKLVAQQTPAEWHISRAKMPDRAAPELKEVPRKPLPLFDYVPPVKPVDEQALVNRVLDALLKRISG